MKPTEELADAHAKVTALQASLSVANGRVRELEALAVRQNDRITDVMKHANNAEEHYRELHARWSLAQRASAQAKIEKRRRDSSVER